MSSAYIVSRFAFPRPTPFAYAAKCGLCGWAGGNRKSVEKALTDRSKHEASCGGEQS